MYAQIFFEDAAVNRRKGDYLVVHRYIYITKLFITIELSRKKVNLFYGERRAATTIMGFCIPIQPGGEQSATEISVKPPAW